MAGLAGQGLTLGGTSAALTAFGAAAVVIVILMFTLAGAIGSAQEGLLTAVKASGLRVKKWGAYIMLTVAMWFLATSAFPATFVPLFS